MRFRSFSRKSVLPFYVGAALLLQPSAWAGTCALCREALQSGGSPGLLKGFYWSIILIASIPLIVMAVAGRFIWRAWRTQKPSRR